MTIRIMVTLPSNIVNLLLSSWDVWSEDFPVIAAIFKSDFAIEFLGQVLANSRRACKKSRTGITFLEDVLHLRSLTVNEVHVGAWQATVMEHADPLLERERCARIWLDNRFVSHEECAHHLQNWDLNWEVEGRDDANTAVWPPVASTKLTCMITWMPECLSQKSNLITAKILKKGSRDPHFTSSLCITLWNTSLDQMDEEIKGLLLMQHLSCFPAHCSEHEVPVFIPKWIV